MFTIRKEEITDNYVKISLKLFLVNLFVYSSLIIFALPHLSIDSYGALKGGLNGHCIQWIGCYRYFGALVCKIWFMLGNNPILNPTMDCIVFIIIVAFSSATLVFFLYKYFLSKSSIKKYDLNSLIIINLCVVISIYNVWFINILTFPECIFGCAIGVLLCHLAIVFYFTIRSYNKILSAILLICSMAVFQQFLIIFIFYVFIFHHINCLDNYDIDSLKNEVNWYSKCFAFSLGCCIVYFVLGKLVQLQMGVNQNSRVALDIHIILKNIKYFIRHQHSFLKGRGYFSSEILTCCYLASAAIWGGMLLLYTIKFRKYLRSFILFLSCTVAYFSSYGMGIISTSRGVRTMCGLFSTFALVSIMSLQISHILKKYNIRYAITVIVVLVFSMNVFKCTEMAHIQIKTNANEKMIAQFMQHRIMEYEEMNCTKINIICISQDSHQDLFKTQSALVVPYALRGLMYNVTGRNFIVKIMDENERKNIFLNKEWDVLKPEEQIVFKNETMYISIY